MSDEQMTTNDNPVQENNTVLGSGSDNQDWKSTLPEELKNDATLQNFNKCRRSCKNCSTSTKKVR